MPIQVHIGNEFVLINIKKIDVAKIIILLKH